MAYYGIDASTIKHSAFELNSDGDLVPTQEFLLDDPHFELNPDNLTDLQLKVSLYFVDGATLTENANVDDLIVYG